MMKLPRFGLRSLFLAVTFVAVWLSTLTGYTGSNDIQAFIWTAIVVMSGVAAINYTGRRCAFWTGFFATMIFMSLKTVFTVYGAKLSWTTKLSMELATKWQGSTAGRGQLVLNINTTLIFVTLLAAALAIGYLSVFVYDQIQKREDR